jgi:hypothetical protein
MATHGWVSTAAKSNQKLRTVANIVWSSRQVVIGGDVAFLGVQRLLRGARSVNQLNKIVMSNTGAVEEFARTLTAKDGAVVGGGETQNTNIQPRKPSGQATREIPSSNPQPAQTSSLAREQSAAFGC